MLYLVQLLLQVEPAAKAVWLKDELESSIPSNAVPRRTWGEITTGWVKSGQEAVKKRSTEQGFRNPSPAFINLKSGLTGQRGAGHFHQVSSPAGLVAVLRFVDVPLLRLRTPPAIPTRTRTLGFRFPRPQNCSPPPPAPSPRRRLDKVVLLTSFFTSVRSSSVRDGAVGSMAEAGDGASSGSRSWLRRPAQAAGFGLRMKGQRGGGEGREGEGCPFEDRWTSKSNCGASGRAEGAVDLLVHKRRSEPRLLLSPGGPGAGTAPRGATGRARPVSTAANQCHPAGRPSSRPLPEPFRSGSAHSLQSVSVWQRGGLPGGHRFLGWGV